MLAAMEKASCAQKKAEDGTLALLPVPEDKILLQQQQSSSSHGCVPVAHHEVGITIMKNRGCWVG